MFDLDENTPTRAPDGPGNTLFVPTIDVCIVHVHVHLHVQCTSTCYSTKFLDSNILAAQKQGQYKSFPLG